MTETFLPREWPSGGPGLVSPLRPQRATRMLCVMYVHVAFPSLGVQDLKCTTNNMRVWDCTWPAPLGVSPGTVKDICIKDR